MNQINWSLGNTIKSIRQRRNISLQELSHGVCSVTTLSRIEANQREPDMLMASTLLERLGYHLEKYELYTSPIEFEQYNQRLEIHQLLEQNKLPEMLDKLKTYEEQVDLCNPLQKQFVKGMYGAFFLKSKEFQKALSYLQEALSLTLVDWRNFSLVSFNELEILINLANLYDLTENFLDATYLKTSLLSYWNKNPNYRLQAPLFYIKTVLVLLPYFYKLNTFQEGLTLCEGALVNLGSTNNLFHWCDILHWKGKYLEKLKDNSTDSKKQICAVFQRAYYAYRLLGQMEDAEHLGTYMKERYEWEPIK